MEEEVKNTVDNSVNNLEEISASIPDSFWDEINAIKSKYPQIKITYASNTYGNSYGNEDDT